ncbi:MAG: hypothetical protein ACFFG0_02475 [Candidatus Thorarchaeota archaeon]
MNSEILNKSESIIKIMKDLDKILCPACNNYEICKGTNIECVLSSAIKARHMVLKEINNEKINSNISYSKK